MKDLIARRTLLLGSLAWLAGCEHSKPLAFKGVDLGERTYGRDFRLRDPAGRERTLADYRGKVVLVHFGYTQCADACPTALIRAAQVKKLLGADADRLQVVFITLDPARDTPQVLGAYSAAFDPSFVALYGDEAGTRAVAEEFRVVHHKVPSGSSYTLDHSTLGFAFDPRGRLRVGLRHAQRAEDCAHDLRQLLA